MSHSLDLESILELFQNVQLFRNLILNHTYFLFSYTMTFHYINAVENLQKHTLFKMWHEADSRTAVFSLALQMVRYNKES
jgi:hypothetical protein